MLRCAKNSNAVSSQPETSSQSPSIAKVKLAHLFGLRPDQLRVFCKRVGGGFGGKQEVIAEDLVALATLDTGRPVCFEYTREEEFTTASPRHPMKITVRLGARADGTLTAFQFRNVSDTGAYGNHGGETLFAAGAAIALYRCANKKFNAYSVYTNNVPSGALRGYGMTQPAFVSIHPLKGGRDHRWAGWASGAGGAGTWSGGCG